MKEIKIFFDEGRKFEPRNIKPLVGIAGLYFIYNKSIEIQYPYGKSKLIYIGMSEKKTNSIGKRLQGHYEGASGNKGIVSYAKVNDVHFTYINFEMLKRTWSQSIEALESYFILDFVKQYGVYPICNNKSGYDILKKDLDTDLIINWKHFK